MNAIERYRRDRRITYQRLAELIGVSKGQACRLAQGKRTIAAEDVARISSLTGIPPRELRPDLAVTFESPAPTPERAA